MATRRSIHLRSLPSDRVKIDRSYVSKIASCDKSRRTVEAIVTFIHSLSVLVHAEGVETQDQALLLNGLGCDFAQGWLYGRAVANSEVGRYFQHVAGIQRDRAPSR
jgi:EAL domain-containing protein (putative c-di-GMP-specific phosphodiesterase class I)